MWVFSISNEGTNISIPKQQANQALLYVNTLFDHIVSPKHGIMLSSWPELGVKEYIVPWEVRPKCGVWTTSDVESYSRRCYDWIICHNPMMAQQ